MGKQLTNWLKRRMVPISHVMGISNLKRKVMIYSTPSGKPEPEQESLTFSKSNLLGMFTDKDLLAELLERA